MAIQVKVCGVRDRDGAQACVDAAVDLAGFNFVKSSKRFIAPQEARALVQLVGSRRSVGVFRNQGLDDVLRMAQDAGVRWVQLHGDESPGFCHEVRNRGYQVIKAIAVTAETSVAQVAAFLDAADLYLFDAAAPGSGRSFEHDRLRSLNPPRPFLLAGGLTPDNVAEAIERVEPDGVDTASGVECEGRMAPARVVAFCRESRRVSPAE